MSHEGTNAGTEGPVGPGRGAPTHRSGFVSLVGRPNAGKSTLVNRLVGTKVSIVSAHPQTTRSEVRGVRTTPDTQIVLLDTPGLHRPRTELGERTNARARATLEEVDVVCQLLDATAPVGGGDRFVADLLAPLDTPTILVVSKIDAAPRDRVVAQLAAADALADWSAVVPVSARTGEGVDALVGELERRLPAGPRYYPDGTVSDQPETAIAAELVREQLLAVTREELPHSIAVSVEVVEDEGHLGAEWDTDLDAAGSGSDLLRLRAVIRVERDSQKGIVIGRGGRVLRDAGTAARHALEALLGTRVHLETVVRVDPNWQRSPGALDRLGF